MSFAKIQPTVEIKNLSKQTRAIAYGVVNPPKLVEPGGTVRIYQWALKSYTSQPIWGEVLGPEKTEPDTDSGASKEE